MTVIYCLWTNCMVTWSYIYQEVKHFALKRSLFIIASWYHIKLFAIVRTLSILYITSPRKIIEPHPGWNELEQSHPRAIPRPKHCSSHSREVQVDRLHNRWPRISRNRYDLPSLVWEAFGEVLALSTMTWRYWCVNTKAINVRTKWWCDIGVYSSTKCTETRTHKYLSKKDTTLSPNNQNMK